jgi:hypothetical protein
VVVEAPEGFSPLATVAVPAPENTGVLPVTIGTVKPAPTSVLPAKAELAPPMQNIAHIATDTALPLYLIILNPVSLRIIFLS